MRDIRHDIQERINLEEAKKEPLARQIAAIEANIATLKQLLQMEELRHRQAIFDARRGQIEMIDIPGLAVREGAAAVVPPVRNKPAAPLISFLLEMLMVGPRSLDDLRAAAQKVGYFKEVPASSPGRMVHGAMLNAIRLGDVSREGVGYAITPKGRERVSTARHRAMEKLDELEA